MKMLGCTYILLNKRIELLADNVDFGQTEGKQEHLNWLEMYCD